MKPTKFLQLPIFGLALLISSLIHAQTIISIDDNLPDDFTPIHVEHFDAPVNNQYFFFAYMRAWNAYPDATPYLIIADNYGTPVFYRKFDYDVMDFKIQPNGQLSYYDNGTNKHYVMDSDLQVVNEADYAGYSLDFHDFHILDNGNYLLLGMEYRVVDMDTVVQGGFPAVTVGNTSIQIQDPNQNVLFEWSGWDHFKITDSYADLLDPNYIDVAHTNALELDDNNTLLLSNRNMYEITKIDMNTGDVIWRLGGKNNEFTYTGLDTLGFSAQHDIRKLPNGLYQLFDNGWEMNPPFSSVLQLDLDEENRVAHVVKRLRSQPEDIMGWIMGNAQYHDDGSMVVCWGSGAPNITEFDANDNKTVEFSYDVASYRAYKFNWETTAFDFNKDNIAFEDVQPGGLTTGSVTITNNLSNEIEINNIVSRTGLFTGNELPILIPAGENREIKISFTSDDLGTYNDVLTICYDVDEESLTQRIAKQITATVDVTEDAAIPDNYVNVLQVYPNPVSDKLNIKNLKEGTTHLSVSTLQGKILKQFSSDSKNLVIDFADLPAGIYILKATYPDGFSSHTKIIRQ